MIIILGGSSSLAKELLPLMAKKDKILCLYNNNKPFFKNKRIGLLKINLENLKTKSLLIDKLFRIKPKEKIVLVNFASIKIDKLSLFISEKEIKRIFDINFFSFLKFIKALLPKMIENKWGRIISISSTGGLRGDKGTVLYTSSKHAVRGMIKSMSKEYGKYNITFNTLKLGNFNYGLFKKLQKSKKKKLLAAVPSNKTGNVINILNAINFLINSDYVNNSEINIDGGM